MEESESSLASAFDALRSGDINEARHVCDELLSRDPENAKVWHASGIVNAQQGELGKAAECFEKAIEFRPDIATYHYNLGLANQSLKDLPGAIDAYQRAADLKSDFLEARNNLGNCLIETGETETAVQHFRKLAESFPTESIVHFNLANVLQDSGEVVESIVEFRTAVELAPDFASARENLGRALSDVELYDEALEVWRQWLQHDPANAVARHMIASITGEETPDRCDDDYVRETFDQNFAKSYEQQLKRIQYKVPELISDAIEQLDIDRSDLDVLDAGCGTGLCASVLRPLAGRLIGIDLSSDMLSEARKRTIYDELHESELTEYLQSGSDRFDLIVSGDTLCYFGELGEVFGGFWNCLADDGDLIFTVERYNEDEASKPFHLQPNGRYQHAESHIRQQLDRAGFSTDSLLSGTLRMERGRPVEGMVVTTKRAPAD